MPWPSTPHAITVRRVLTDNSNQYRSRAFPDAMQELGIRHIRTHPYTPRANGKAEAMVKILLSGCADAHFFAGDNERSEALQLFVEFYNHRRPRAAWTASDQSTGSGDDVHGLYSQRGPRLSKSSISRARFERREMAAAKPEEPQASPPLNPPSAPASGTRPAVCVLGGAAFQLGGMERLTWEVHDVLARVLGADRVAMASLMGPAGEAKSAVALA